MSMNLLQIVNRRNLLDESFIPEDLVEIINREGNVVYVPSILWEAFTAMSNEGELHNQFLDITSGYRSYERQERLFEKFVRKIGREETLKKVALPGASEHQLGLGIDVSNFTPDGVMRDDEERFKWLHENCARFGFIIRYKKEYQNITGVTEEPWHLRYVGNVASKIKSLDLPLEEIVERQLV